MDAYRRLLGRIDAWYRSVQAAHPDKVTCTKGCRDCCLGLFDITPADRDLLRAGMALLDPAVRTDIEARAGAILARLRAKFPGLGASLAGLSEQRIDEICELLGPVECPVLGTANECRLYEHRPLTCRLHGVPVVDLSGEPLHAEGCAKCNLRADEAPRLDCGALCRDEARILRRRYGAEGDVPLLIPQAVSGEGNGGR